MFLPLDSNPENVNGRKGQLCYRVFNQVNDVFFIFRKIKLNRQGADAVIDIICMKYQRYPPPRELGLYVRYFWSYESEDADLPKLYIESFADRFPRLIFQNLDQYESLRDGEGNLLPPCYLSGVDTRPTLAVMDGRFSHFGVSFYPHALNVFFNTDATQLANQMPDITHFASPLFVNKLRQAGNMRERVELTARFLIDLLSNNHSSRQEMNLILHNGAFTADADLDRLHEQFKVSERQLERLFKASVGITPKKYQRILRFEKALEKLGVANYAQLTSISYELNFSDQAHFIHDFKSFSGISPYEFVRRRKIGAESSSFITVKSNSI